MDDTLMFTPIPDVDHKGDKILRFEGKKSYLHSEEYYKNTGTHWPYSGWWGRKESLCPKSFNIKRNEYVYQEYLRDRDANNYVIMMTGRIKPLEKEVKHILHTNGLIFDEYHFNPGGINTLDYKIEVLDKYIQKFSDLKTVKLYDDRDEHMPSFYTWAENTRNRTKVDIEVIHIKGEKRIN